MKLLHLLIWSLVTQGKFGNSLNISTYFKVKNG